MKRISLMLILALLFLKVAAQNYTQVYLIGGAAPNGWDNNKAEYMTPVSTTEENAIFTWTGPLKASDFKFINTLGTWQPSFNAPTENEPIELGKSHNLVYNESGNDHKFMLSESGFYTVTVDLKKLTMVVEKANVEIPEELWITGTAIPEGTVKLSKIYGVANFAYNGELQQGELKIMTTPTPDETTEYIIPSEEAMDITGKTTLTTTTDSKQPGWNVMVADPAYKIKIDLVAKEVNAEIYKSPEMLYIVGGATECGWNVDSAIPFTKDTNNPDQFVFTGELKIRPENVGSNEFKILGQRTWDPYSLHPYTENEKILESTSFRIGGNDTKWIVDSDKQGIYTITVNTFYETISARFESTSKVDMLETDKYFHYNVSGNEAHVSMIDGYSADNVQLISLDGKIVYSAQNKTNSFTISNNSATGIYIFKISCNGKVFAQQVALQ